MLPRQNRVLTAAEFRQGFKSPVRTSTDWASFYLVELPLDSATKIGFVVGGIVGNAVARNRVKRRLREASRMFLKEFPLGFQLTIRVRREASEIDFQKMVADVQAASVLLTSKVMRG